MKKSFFILTIFLMSGICYGQIEIQGSSPARNVISEIKPMGEFHSQLYYTTENGDTTYTIMYRNADYKTIIDLQYISFKNEENTLAGLYNLLNAFFSPDHKKDKDYNIHFKLGKQNITAMNMVMGGRNAIMVYADKGYFFLDEKYLDKLLGNFK